MSHEMNSNMEPQQVLHFLGSSFHGGLEVTIRDGDKWYRALKRGKIVDLCVCFGPPEACEHIVFSEARIEFTFLSRFGDLPKAILQFEHDPECRTMDGLRKAMVRAYGQRYELTDGYVNPEVTVVGFRRLDVEA